MISLTRLLTEECENCNSHSMALIEYISKSVLTLDEVIKDLTQILSARSPIHEKIEDVNLPDIIKSVESNLEKQISKSSTTFLINIDENARHFKSINSYVQSILYNLISNAIKYSKENTHPIISIKAEKSNNAIILTVTDNGIGLNLDKVGPQLFGLYKKFTFHKEGRGLGLHMTKTQVESLGGTIEVISKEGIGTTFVIRIPV
jgi:signal transduction histidine kinase